MQLLLAGLFSKNPTAALMSINQSTPPCCPAEAQAMPITLWLESAQDLISGIITTRVVLQY